VRCGFAQCRGVPYGRQKLFVVRKSAAVPIAALPSFMEVDKQVYGISVEGNGGSRRSERVSRGRTPALAVTGKKTRGMKR
jgi:hypothetical protein